ncbi:hypothetical protein JNM87_04355 [Candidatus Saccharibacteria bacterium]|nr:hypothetical protein [Candidatus Saccharibacteria bacterium]
MQRLNQKGIGHVLVVVFVLAIAVVGFTGYKIMTANKKVEDTPAAVQQQSVSTQHKVEAVPELKQADDTLEQTSTELDSTLDTSALDKDIDAML